MDIEKFINNTDNADMPLVSRLLYQLIDEKYRTLLDESSDFMCIADREGKFIYVNKKLVDSLGYTKKEMMGLYLFDIVASESRHEFTEKTRDFLKKGKTKIDNFVLKTKLGGKIVGEMNSIAFYDNRGKVCGVRAVFKDRTKILEIERLERKYESMLEDGIDSLDYVIIILDREFKVCWASTSIRKYFGLDKTAIVGEDMRALLKDKVGTIVQQGEAFLKNLLGAYETNRPVESFECVISSPINQKSYSIEHWSYPITHGELQGGRIEIFRDITARKKSEETLEYYYKKVHTIMEHAVEGVVELRTDNSVEFVNSSFLNKLGYSEMDMLDHNIYDFILADERSRLVSVKLIRRARELTFIKKDKTLFYGLVSSIPLAFGTQPPHVLCFISDINEVKHASLKLKEANMTLRAVNDSLIDLSVRDVTTGIYNARYLKERLSEELKRARRYFRPFSLIMVDIDFFKAINDTYGHSFGDIVLRGLAGLLKKNVRETDVVIRQGGEEFVVFLPDTGNAGALAVAHKIAFDLRQTPLGNAAAAVTITVSMGIVSFPEAGVDELDRLLEAVDQAMYQSKIKGRNRITVFNKESLEEKEKGTADKDIFIRDLKGRLKNIYLRNEESIMESLRPMVREADKKRGYGDDLIEKFLKNIEGLTASFSLPENEAFLVKRAAFLCNLGFLSVPSVILLKEGSLKKEELCLIQEHPWRSAQIIRDIPFLLPLESEILCHHERYDGTGYPRGLKGDDIPLGARIISVAEAYGALTTPRPYRPSHLSSKEATEVIKKESGKQFDPLVVEHFLKVAA
jgi:diguanylate cyclase (GGDEF)-like protein/PAS domain S-box-containing protein